MPKPRSAMFFAAALVLLPNLALHGQQVPSAPTPQGTGSAAMDAGTPGSNLLLPEETPLRVRAGRVFDSEHIKAGEPVVFTLTEDAKANGTIAIPRGATLRGKVAESGKNAGKSQIVLKLESLELGGKIYKVYAYEFSLQGRKNEPTVTGTNTGKVDPATAAAQAGNGWGTTASGTATSDTHADKNVSAGLSFGSAKPVTIAADAQIEFYLASPLAVQPVSAEQAAQLARKVPPGEPKTILRGERY